MIDIFSELKKLDFPLGQYVVVGGSMEAHGIRKAKDLDIVVTPMLYKYLYHEGWQQCTCERCLESSRLDLKKGNVEVLPNYMLGNYIGDTTKLIQNADMINGYPFVQLTELVKFKRELGRPKDMQDIKLIEGYLKRNKR